MTILDSFGAGEASLALGEIARRTRLHKSTVLRIARTMATAGYLVQLADGSWRLGRASGWLGSRYNMAFDAILVEPVLQEVTRLTGESSSFYVREGNSRICIARVEGRQSVKDQVRIGQSQTLDKGAPGRVLLAYSGEPGEVYEHIRRAGFHSSHSERNTGLASVAFPVFGINYELVGCISVFGPVTRFGRAAVLRYARVVRKAATRLTFDLSKSQRARRERDRRTSNRVAQRPKSAVTDHGD